MASIDSSDPDPGARADSTEIGEGPFRRNVETVGDCALFALDAAGRVATWNVGAERVTGFSATQVVGRPYACLYTEDDRRAKKPDMDLTIAVHEGARCHQQWRVRSDGSRYWAETVLTSIRDARGTLIGFVEVARDITERQQFEADRDRMQEQLLVSDRMASLGLLAAGVAHEINNPLAFVVANVDYSLRELREVVQDDPALAGRLEDVLDALDNAKQGAERIKQTAGDLKIFARTEELVPGPIDVRRVLDSCTNMAQNEIKHRARLVKDYQEVPFVEASEARIGQVFLNVLLNAAHAIPEGRSDINEIRLTIRRVGEQVTVEVRDSGAGISGEHLEKIFEPFFTTKPIGVGTGLGLPICRRIIEGYGGRIEVESEVGKGTAFRVVLPASEAVPSMPAPSPAPATDGRRGRVLVIDDEPMLVEALRRTLERDHDVITVVSAREALARLATGEEFDVVICDVMMPELTGADLFAELRVIAEDMLPRVIFLTGGAFTPRARDFLEGIKNPRLEKPFDPEKLRAFVRKLIR